MDTFKKWKYELLYGRFGSWGVRPYWGVVLTLALAYVFVWSEPIFKPVPYIVGSIILLKLLSRVYEMVAYLIKNLRERRKEKYYHEYNVIDRSFRSIRQNR